MFQKRSTKTLRKTKIALRIFVFGWRTRPLAVLSFFAGAALEIAGFVVSIYATSKLAGLLATFSVGSSTADIWFWLWVDVAAAASMGVAFWAMSLSKRLLFFAMATSVIDLFQGALCYLDIPDFYDNDTRNQINKVQGGGYIWQIPGLCDILLDLVYAMARFVVMAIVVAQITWWLIPVIALFLLPALFLESKLAKTRWFVWDKKGDDRHVFWGLEWLMRQAKNQMELRSMQVRTVILQRLHTMNTAFYKEQERQNGKIHRFMGPAKIIEVGGTATGSVIALQQFLTGLISFDRYFFLLGALMRIGGAMNTIFGTLGRLQEPLLLAQDYFAIVERKPKHIDKPNAFQLPMNQVSEIVFEDISFTYPKATKPVFNGLSFTIKPGEHVAIVGENGAGKSTLIKLLLRFYKPTSGRILINGYDLQDIAIESWYAQLATLFQEFNQYPFSIAENIELARPEFNHDKKHLRTAAQFSNVDQFVKKYKHGWETVLDNSFEKGVEPSGGQWQRVALARAFYRNANVLILDEPTAAIDAKAEYDIFNNIFAHYQNKTTIIVSHRFSTVRRADTIIVVDKGKIIESGSHAVLMKNKSLYHELFSKQAEGYQ